VRSKSELPISWRIPHTQKPRSQRMGEIAPVWITFTKKEKASPRDKATAMLHMAATTVQTEPTWCITAVLLSYGWRGRVLHAPGGSGVPVAGSQAEQRRETATVFLAADRRVRRAMCSRIAHGMRDSHRSVILFEFILCNVDPARPTR
jgi:hypothetical protein